MYRFPLFYRTLSPFGPKPCLHERLPLKNYKAGQGYQRPSLAFGRLVLLLLLLVIVFNRRLRGIVLCQNLSRAIIFQPKHSRTQARHQPLRARVFSSCVCVISLCVQGSSQVAYALSAFTCKGFHHLCAHYHPLRARVFTSCVRVISLCV